MMMKDRLKARVVVASSVILVSLATVTMMTEIATTNAFVVTTKTTTWTTTSNTVSSKNPTTTMIGRKKTVSSGSNSNSKTALFGIEGTFGGGGYGGYSRGLAVAMPETDQRTSNIILPEPIDPVGRSTTKNNNNKCLISGVVNAKERTDQFIFDLVNDKDSCYDFDTIIAFVNDEKFSKKRLLSRSARYTGLLDKLVLMEAKNKPPTSTTGTNTPMKKAILPTAEELDGVTTWIACLEGDDGSDIIQQVKNVVNVINSAPSIQQLGLLLSIQPSTNNDTIIMSEQDGQTIVDLLHPISNMKMVNLTANITKSVNMKAPRDTGIQYTVVATGPLDDDRPEGRNFYRLADFGNSMGIVDTYTTESGEVEEKPLVAAVDLSGRLIMSTSPPKPIKTTFSREEAYRLITVGTQLELGINRCFMAYDCNDENATEYNLVRSLRQSGYTRIQEVEFMMRDGPKIYSSMIREWKGDSSSYDFFDYEAQLKDPEFQELIAKDKERKLEEELEFQKEQEAEITKYAMEWGKREYYKQCMAGNINFNDITEEEFIQSVWDRALFEGDIVLKQMNGEEIPDDIRTPYTEFKTRMRKMEQVMEQRVRDEYDMIQEEEEDYVAANMAARGFGSQRVLSSKYDPDDPGVGGSGSGSATTDEEPGDGPPRGSRRGGPSRDDDDDDDVDDDDDDDDNLDIDEIIKRRAARNKK